ncbi:hopanoid-associated sugar epimerase [Telmatospirillum sp.]|uniref:hopanoid-associated sugar epimerase n=1 Tax=Telmatospirillum sp. TaxID=2079197 RepID=UPI002845F4CE|nr:hopanoid-associated sugar epimerase [Telmatospirillum sp.]MDR3439304.1 NAD-dependent epimerase/dehydratase family protein [Telmatospirillum sp.]
MERTTLVTGATGFVGSAVVRTLLAAGHTVRVLVRKGSNRRNLADLDVHVVEGDLENPHSLKTAVAGCQFLFHVAADYRLWVRDPAAMLRTNVEGTRSLMRAAVDAGATRVVYTSSVATLGHRLDGPADETTPSTLADMPGAYKRSKFLAEEEVRRMIAKEGLPAVIVNPSTPIGPGDIKPTPTGRLIVEAASGKIPAYVDTGLNVVHVDDVAAGHLLALEKGTIGERYVLGGDDLPLAEILAIIARTAGRRPPSIRLPRLPLYPLAIVAEAWGRISGREPMLTLDGLKMAKWHMWFSSAKAEQVLGYRHRPAEQAINDAYQWFRQAGYCR